jgi:non-specific serine/threonine protein kinase
MMQDTRLIGNRYRLEEPIAQGMMGPVYRGTDTRTGDLVAVKILAPGLLESQQDSLSRFRREAAALKQLNHPNIVHFSDLIEDSGEYCLVMEYVPGGSLDAKLRAGPLSVERALEIALDLADALARAHRLDIVHRDVKPQNILLAADGTPRLSDFGLAHPVSSYEGATPVLPAGTVLYMPPEAFRGHAPDERTDIWSLGIVLFEMLAGHAPFEADSASGLIQRIVDEAGVDFSPLPPQIPGALRELLGLMLTKDPAERIASVRLVGAALEAICNDREAAMPRIPGADRRTAVAGSLPALTTTFVGRERAIAEVMDLFALPGGQLVTLTGPGGVGKTRLAVEAARRMRDRYDDGIFFVDLAPILDPDLVASRVARVLGVKESGGRSLVQDIYAFLQEKRCLLILDNFEQVIEAAPVVAALSSGMTQLDILVTSREALNLSRERVVPVHPLSLPDHSHLQSPVALSQVEAVALFVQRAAEAQPGFRLSATNARHVAEICIQLDGLPLAIELAAARTRVLPPQYLRDELRDVLSTLTGGPRDGAERQRTLRATIDWSYRLLSEQEKKLFARLAVFHGGRSLEAIEAVCMPELTIGMFGGLESLVSKNLLLRGDDLAGEPRFVYLETIHQYAWERLLESGEADVIRMRHTEYFTRLVEVVVPGLRGPEQESFLRVIRTEYDNVRAALSWSLGDQEYLLGIRLVVALSDFWYYEGSVAEGSLWPEQALAKAGAAPLDLQAQLLNSAGLLAFSRGDHEVGERWHEQALALARLTGDKASAAWALFWLSAHATASPEKYESGIEKCRQSLVLFEETGDHYGLAWGNNQIGELSRLLGRYEDAQSAYLASLAICRATGNLHREAIALVNLGYVARHRGAFQEAESYVLEGLALLYHLRLMHYTAISLATLAGPVASQGEARSAATLLGASEAAFTKLAIPRQPADRMEVERYLAQTREALDAAEFQAAWDRGKAMTLDEAVAFAFLRRR